MTEFEEALKIANLMLDKPYQDPDSDVCILARQFLRAIETPPNKPPHKEERSDNGFPRRNRIDLWTPLEKEIRKAHDAVENAGAHPLLTEAGSKILEAFELVADWTETEGKNHDRK